MVAGFDARREWVETTDFTGFRVLHIATHGVVDDERPELSGIVLSLVDEKGTPRNGFLRLPDIYNLRLPVDLVVLSACETGLGKEVKGEGILNLVRGFMYAGAPAVIASSWKVDDTATSELMAELYRGLFAGKSPAAALREAQVALRKLPRFRSPYYWAAFELQGDWR
jgi:CHAT domain-containing protein